MLRHLVEFAAARPQEMPPPGYRLLEPVQWILEVGADGRSRIVEGGLERPRPSRNRAAGIDPLLLADSAQYVLGLSDGKGEARARKACMAFWDLVARAERETGNAALQGLARAPTRFPAEGMERVKPKDVVMVRRKGGGVPFEEPDVQAFWKDYLEREMASPEAGECGACGRQKPLLRILPTGIKGFPQDVKLTSFNLEAFESYGLSQGLNAPLCFECGSMASAAFSRLLESPRHRLRLVRGDGLADQVAVFWLKQEMMETPEGEEVDVGALLQVLGTGRLASEEPARPTRAALSDVERLVRLPWKPRDASLRTDSHAFHIAVLSANVSRLVVRDWLHGSLEQLQRRLAGYLDATRLVDGWGGDVRSAPLQPLLDALGAYHIDAERRSWKSDPAQPGLVRAVLAAIYQGHPAPLALTVKAVRVARIPSLWAVDRLAHPLLAAVKLERNLNGDMSMKPELDPTNASVAYQAGRLLAVLEKAQAYSAWKSGTRRNVTLVERSYGAASTAPRMAFPPLVRLAATAHLPKAGFLEPVMEEVMGRIKDAGGLPRTFDLHAQAEFAMGFYQQRAHFRAQRKPGEDDESAEAPDPSASAAPHAKRGKAPAQAIQEETA